MEIELKINIAKLRNDLKDYYGTGAFSVSPAMTTEVWAIDRMSNQEVINKAISAGFNIFNYQV